MRLKKNEVVRYREVIDAFQKETGCEVVEIKDVVRWALDKHHLNGDWDPVAWHSARAAEALRCFSGPSRDWYCVNREVTDPETQELTQKMLWGHRDSAPEDFLAANVEQRLRGVQQDFAAISRDVEDIARTRPALGVRLRQRLIDFKLA